ncbi:MAG: hypothetical protein KJZ69_04485 [Phycisphaerales bacterium]|nr:hypothetical protein [Phycisphaerales bacterium]
MVALGVPPAALNPFVVPQECRHLVLRFAGADTEAVAVHAFVVVENAIAEELDEPGRGLAMQLLRLFPGESPVHPVLHLNRAHEHFARELTAAGRLFVQLSLRSLGRDEDTDEDQSKSTGAQDNLGCHGAALSKERCARHQDVNPTFRSLGDLNDVACHAWHARAPNKQQLQVSAAFGITGLTGHGTTAFGA